MTPADAWWSPYRAPPDDALAVIERQRLDDARSYGLLYDLRHMTGRLTLAELRQILSRAAPRPAEPRGLIAVVATDPLVYGMACSYAAIGRATLTIEVFRDWNEAEEWLTATLKG
jgi:hypothetical protein